MANKPRIMNMRPDPPDLRDRLYNPTLRALEPEFNARPFDHETWRNRVKNQGETSACTGFALAAMVEALASKSHEGRQQRGEQPIEVSPFMLYYFARRYDELRGSDPDGGSTARGAMKSWHKHGVCRLALWPEMDAPPLAPVKREPTRKQGGDAQPNPGENWVGDAFRMPLGAYYRVDHSSIADLHAALSETGVVYVTAQTHDGWDSPQRDGRIVNRRGGDKEGHAFLLVDYDASGFWIQNSWGREWGLDGFAHLDYADWLENGMDAWIGQLGVYVTSHMDSLGQGLKIRRAKDAGIEAKSSEPMVFAQAMLSSNGSVRAQQINPYIVNLENNGKLSDHGKFRTNEDDLHDLARFYLPNALDDWELKEDDPIDIALYAHGGLVSENSAAETAAQWIPALYADKIFPVFFMWETGLLQTVGNIISEALGFTRAAAGGFKDRLLDFVDDRLEGLIAPESTPIWEEIKENALQATVNPNGGLRLLAKELNGLPPALTRRIRFHLIGHSAGAVFHAHLLPALLQAELTVQGIYLMAPACRVDLFRQNVLPAYEAGKVLAYTQFQLSDKVEQDDNCAALYNRSLLYLVSNACERKPATPILGMEKFAKLINPAKPPSSEVKVWDFITAPTESDAALTRRCRATSHSAFDNDSDTILAILERIKPPAK